VSDRPPTLPSPEFAPDENNHETDPPPGRAAQYAPRPLNAFSRENKRRNAVAPEKTGKPPCPPEPATPPPAFSKRPGPPSPREQPPRPPIRVHDAHPVVLAHAMGSQGGGKSTLADPPGAVRANKDHLALDVPFLEWAKQWSFFSN